MSDTGHIPHLARRRAGRRVTRTTRRRSLPGMVVLDAVHNIQAEQANDLAVRWNCKAGKCGSCSAEINGMPRLMCMTRLNHAAARPAGHGGADEGFPAHQGSGDRRFVELRSKENDREVQAAQAGCSGRNLAHAPGGRRSRPGISQVHRMLSVPGCLPRAARPSHARPVHRAAFSRLYGRARDESAGYRRIASASLRKNDGIGLCNITKCCTKVCPEGITITDNAIIPLKERVVDRFFDPLARLFRIFK